MQKAERAEVRRAQLKALAAIKGGAAALGREAGWRDGSYIGQLVRGTRPITEDVIEKLESLPGCADWFQSGRGDDSAVEARESSGVGYVIDSHFHVPVLSTRAAMGDGELQPSDEVVLGELNLSRTWLETRFGRKSASLRFIYAVGDSMEPTIVHGAILLVDTAVHEAGPDGIYVLETNGLLYVKRVRNSFAGGHEISSDNPVVKTVDALDGSKPVSVLGRVVWLWNGRGV